MEQRSSGSYRQAQTGGARRRTDDPAISADIWAVRAYPIPCSVDLNSLRKKTILNRYAPFSKRGK
jgi:hypothetical protein